MEVARRSYTTAGLEHQRWQGLVLASGVAGMVQHAAGEYVSAGENFGAAVALVVGQGEDPRGAARLETQRDHLVAPALKQVCVICGGGVVVC